MLLVQRTDHSPQEHIPKTRILTPQSNPSGEDQGGLFTRIELGGDLCGEEVPADGGCQLQVEKHAARFQDAAELIFTPLRDLKA